MPRRRCRRRASGAISGSGEKPIYAMTNQGGLVVPDGEITPRARCTASPGGGTVKEKRLDYELDADFGDFPGGVQPYDNRGFFLYQVPGCSGVNAVLSLLLATICKIAVPLFFMISGGLLLHRQESLKDLSGNALCGWGLYWCCFRGFSMASGSTGASCPIREERISSAGSHRGISIPYWYLYTYFGVLLLFPLLRPLAQNLSEEGYLWLFGVHFAFFGIIAPLSSILRLEPLNQYFVTGPDHGNRNRRNSVYGRAGRCITCSWATILPIVFPGRSSRKSGLGCLACWRRRRSALWPGLADGPFFRRGETSGTFMGSLMEIVTFFVLCA